MKTARLFSILVTMILHASACHRSETKPPEPAASQAPRPVVTPPRVASDVADAAPIAPFVGEIEVLHENLDERGRPLERQRLLDREVYTIDGALERYDNGKVYVIVDWSEGTVREVIDVQRYVTVSQLRQQQHPRSRPFTRSGRVGEIAGIRCDWGRAETERETAEVCVAEGLGSRSLMNRYFGADAALNWPSPLLILEANLPSNSAVLRRRVVRISRGPVPPERFTVPADYKVNVVPSTPLGD